MTTRFHLCLASQSPRRSELLTQDEWAKDYVARLAAVVLVKSSEDPLNNEPELTSLESVCNVSFKERLNEEVEQYVLDRRMCR